MLRPSERDLRQQIVEVCARLWTRHLVAGTEGNVSARVDSDRFLVTPAGGDKGFLDPRSIVITNAAGLAVSGGAPTSELPMHLAVYSARPDVQAVVHAHAPSVVAATVAAIDLNRAVLPEAILALHGIGVAPYARPGTTLLAQSAAEALRHSDAGVLSQHGAVTVGRTPLEALHRMEMLDAVADALLRAHAAGRVQDLAPEEQEALYALAKDLRSQKN